MPHKKPHYHVNTINSYIAVPGVIAKDEVAAGIELQKMVTFVRDVTGSHVISSTESQVNLSDGTKVRYRKCYGTCLPD